MDDKPDNARELAVVLMPTKTEILEKISELELDHFGRDVPTEVLSRILSDVVQLIPDGAAPNIGIASWVAQNGSEDFAEKRLNFRIPGIEGAPEHPSLIFIIIPTNLSNDSSPLTLSINGAYAYPLLSFSFDPVSAMQLIPGALYQVIAAVSRRLRASRGRAYVFAEPLTPRP